jgi:hypothetical protein
MAVEYCGWGIRLDPKLFERSVTALMGASGIEDMLQDVDDLRLSIMSGRPVRSREDRRMTEGAGRYRVVLGSESGHCCFDATVVDTSRPELNGDGKPFKKYGSEELRYETICECFDADDASRIAAALNETAKADDA